jgi:hypothetical protein
MFLETARINGIQPYQDAFKLDKVGLGILTVLKSDRLPLGTEVINGTHH